MGFRHHTSMKWCMGACRCCLLLLYLFVYIHVKRWSISLHDALCGKNEAPKWCLKKNFVKQYPWRRKVTGYMFFFFLLLVMFCWYYGWNPKCTFLIRICWWKMSRFILCKWFSVSFVRNRCLSLCCFVLQVI